MIHDHLLQSLTIDVFSFETGKWRTIQGISRIHNVCFQDDNNWLASLKNMLYVRNIGKDCTLQPESMLEDQEICGAAASNEILVWVHDKAKYVLKHRNMVEAILQQFVSHGFSFGLGCDFSESEG